MNRDMPQLDDVVDIEICDGADGTLCFGRSEEGAGIMVRGPVVPGDHVRGKVVREKKNYVIADYKEMLSPHPSRIEPRCKFFGTCGGCKWQVIPYEEELALKRRRIETALERIAGTAKVPAVEILGSENPYEYRNKISLEVGNGGQLSFNPFFPGAGLVEIDHCPIAHERINRVLSVLQDALSRIQSGMLDPVPREIVLRCSLAKNEVLINVVAFKKMTPLMNHLRNALREAELEVEVHLVLSVMEKGKPLREHTFMGTGKLEETLAGMRFLVGPGSFFQVHPKQAENLLAYVMDCLELGENDEVLDLFCGVGTFSLPIAQKIKSVFGVEGSAQAVAQAEENAKLNELSNVRFAKGDLHRKGLDRILSHKKFRPTKIVADPARDGMGPKVCQALVDSQVERIVLVSCHPETLARDLKVLLEQGYGIDRWQGFDLFPRTQHVETVVSLTHA